MIELEKKLLLTEDEYSCLLEHFGKGKSSVKQINYYFDTEDLAMNRQNITCRIRLKDGKYKATMKRHTSGTDYSTETDMEVRDGIYENAFVDMGLKLQGKLVTKRCILMKDTNYEVVLDRNEYLGYTDYELEIEYSPDNEQDAYLAFRTIANVLLHRNSTLTLKDITLHFKSTRSKSKRFFEKISTNFFNDDSSCHH